MALSLGRSHRLVLLLLPHLTLQEPSTTTVCTPGALSMWYEKTFYIVEHIGAAHGWDASDPRYRYPANNEEDGLHGGTATTIYRDPKTNASLYLASKHTAWYDTVYLGEDCMNIKALVNMDSEVPQYIQQPTQPAWGFGDYPSYAPSEARQMPRGPVPSFAQISVPGDGWFLYIDHIFDFIDQQLVAGNSTLIYDGVGGCDVGDREDEWCEITCQGVCKAGQKAKSCGPDCTGCGGGAAVAIAYMMRTEGTSLRDAYVSLCKVRPCIMQLTGMEESEVMGLTPRRYSSELDKLADRLGVGGSGGVFEC